jgi:hypothetical protein
MATYFFHEEQCPSGEEDIVELVRYYYDDISTEILTRSFRVAVGNAQTEFVGNDRIPLADLRADLKAKLVERQACRAESERRSA